MSYVMSLSLEDNIVQVLVHQGLASSIAAAMKAAHRYTLWSEWKGERVDLRQDPSFIEMIRDYEIYHVKIYLAERRDFGSP